MAKKSTPQGPSVEQFKHTIKNHKRRIMGNSVHIRNRNGRLYIETYIYGKQARRSLGLTLTGSKMQNKKIWKLAEVIRSRQEMQLACAEWGIADIAGSEKNLCIYIEENYQKSKNYTLGRCLFYLKKYRFSSARLNQITPQWIEDFQTWLLSATGLSQGSASLYSSALRHQLKLAVRDRLLTSSPADFVKNIPMPESKKQPLTVAEIKQLAVTPLGGNLGQEIKMAFLFSCFTGLRVSDLRSLEWNMINQRDDGTYWICKTQKKTGTRVFIPLNKTAQEIIGYKDLNNRQQKVFPRIAATKANTDQYLKKWGLRAKIPNLSWHTARHTMATIALECGADLRTVSELLGHKDISTTLRYAKATDTLKKSAVNAFPVIFNENFHQKSPMI